MQEQCGHLYHVRTLYKEEVTHATSGCTVAGKISDQKGEMRQQSPSLSAFQVCSVKNPHPPTKRLLPLCLTGDNTFLQVSVSSHQTRGSCDPQFIDKDADPQRAAVRSKGNATGRWDSLGQVPFLVTISGVRFRQKGDKHVCLDPGRHMREERRREWELGSFVAGEGGSTTDTSSPQLLYQR